MAKYVYPAIFTKEENGQYSVRFPDVPNCFTGGDSLIEAIYMAQDALGLVLYDMEQRKEKPASVSDFQSISGLSSEEFVSLIACDTWECAKKLSNQAVKKTLTIPAWLNAAAIEKNINFSQTLQDALKEAIGTA